MLLSSALSVGAFALSTNAFLIPGDTAAAVQAFEHPDLVRIQQEQNAQDIKLDCTSCPYALSSLRNGRHEWTGGIASELEMKFDTDGQSLRFNGVPFYPITAPGLPPLLHVHQVAKEGQPEKEAFPDDLRLSYSLEYSEKAFEDSNSLLTVEMTVMGLDGEMVKIDDIEIKAVKDSEGKLTLHSVSAIPANPNGADAKCGNVLCRVFTKLITGMKKVKTSAKSAGHKIKCFCMKCFKHMPGHKHFMRPHHHHHHKGPEGMEPHHRPDVTIEIPAEPVQHLDHPHDHARGNFMHRFATIMWTTIRIAFVPILIGVAFGMAASAIGMLVGQIIVFVWMRYRHNGQAVYEPISSDEKEVPPPYEDVTTAEALSEKEVEDKA